MRRYSKAIFWGGGLVAVLFIVTGILFYFIIVSPSDLALRHAEAFLFRRMAVAQLADQDQYRYFYATNRRPQAADGPVEERFGNQRQGALAFGRFDTRIEPTLGIGMLINPTEWLQNEEIKLEEIRRLEQEAFVAELRGLVEKSPERSLLIVIHGFREAFPSALRKTAFVGHVLDINTPVLLFDWPGDQGATPQGYRRAHGIARESGAELAELLRLIDRDIRPERLWVVANSMGAQVVADAVTVLFEEGGLEDKMEEVVLTAPDVDRAALDSSFKQKIDALMDHLTVYVSSNDRALIMSRLINRNIRLGESTLSPDQLEEAVMITEMIDPDEDTVTLIDATPINRTRNFHNFSLETPEFFDDLFLRLTNRTTPHTRLLYKVEAPSGARYWVLTRGR